MIGHVFSATVAAFAAVLLDPSATVTVDHLAGRFHEVTNGTLQPLFDAAAPLTEAVAPVANVVATYANPVAHVFYNAIIFLVLTYLFEALRRTGVKGLAGAIVRGIRVVPGVNELILAVLQGEIKSSLKELTNDTSDANAAAKTSPIFPIPAKGLGRKATLKLMDSAQKSDGEHCHEGRAFAFSYFNDAGRFKGHTKFLTKVYDRFAEKASLPGKELKHVDALANDVFVRYAHGNGLNPLMFPTLRKYETEVVSMTASMLNGDASVVGALTSGGTESILMTVGAHTYWLW